MTNEIFKDYENKKKEALEDQIKIEKFLAKKFFSILYATD
jgi:hypothetical protein